MGKEMSLQGQPSEDEEYEMDKGVENCMLHDGFKSEPEIVCVCACGDDLQSSQREMDADPNAKCVCVLHDKHTADLCHHWILLWPTTGHKGQIEESGVTLHSSSPFSS